MSAVDVREPATLARTTSGAPLPSALERARLRWDALHRGRERLWAWLGALAVTALAFAMRIDDLGSPRRFAFDETYYAKDAWALLTQGYVRDYLDTVGGQDVNDAILDGRTSGIWAEGPSMEVHPEVGKWLIALGEKAFGMDPFGWRISAVVAGSLMVLVICRLGRRLTGSTVLGLVAGLLLTFDGLQFVLSRLALLDIYLALFLLCAVACVVNDRDWFRRRLADRWDGAHEASGAPAALGPVAAVLVRPWLLAGGVCFGLALGTKWTAAYPLAAFGVLVWLWSAGARRAHGVRWARLRTAFVDGAAAFVQLVGVAALVYVASWTGWLIHASEYEQHLSSTQYTGFIAENGCTGEGEDRTADNSFDDDARWPTATEPDATGPGELVQSLRSLWYYHRDVYTFHTHYLNCADHTYRSDPLGWPLIGRTVGVATDLDVQPGEDGCTAEAGSVCYRQVLLIGTPVLWWSGAVALLAAAALWIGRRDWRFGVPVVGMLASWLPWTLYDSRPIFYFYAVAFLPFTVLALTMVCGAIIGPDRTPSRRRTAGVVVTGTLLVLVVANFAYLHPLLTYEVIPREAWLDRMWLQRWI
ncbi:dolichyl-phosphate-mannose--protein mannosyltransferase [Nocardioides sp.]|uniref:dolichyl-phosphate-mannose--protein mannosyltransferase n=1 Tax=Nocardioides sp. TaxID=35761 RepID=UPI003510F999